MYGNVSGHSLLIGSVKIEKAIQWSAGHSGTVHVNPAPYIFVISQPKWLKFGLQPHLNKMFLHTKFQLSITCTFRVTKLLVEVFSTI